MAKTSNGAIANPLQTILFAGFLAGTLDITAAIVILGKMNAGGVLRYIASGIFGPPAFTGGPGMIVAGLLCHYFIAFSFTIVYFFIYPRAGFLRKNPLLSAVVLGIVTWIIMNLLVVPLTRVSVARFSWNRALLNMAILIVMIGLPVAVITHWYYRSTRLLPPTR